LNNVVPNLHNILDVKFNSIEDVNACVDNFSVLLNNCVLPFCEVREHKHYKAS
jgi:hypothetical protein